MKDDIADSELQRIADSELQRDVLDELKCDPGVNAAHIGVSAKNGVVTLSSRERAGRFPRLRCLGYRLI